MTTATIGNRYEPLPGENPWRALEDAMTGPAALPLDTCAEFMWMGASVIRFDPGGPRSIHHYKHRDTRAYVHLDLAGRTYRYTRISGRPEGEYRMAPYDAAHAIKTARAGTAGYGI